MSKTRKDKEPERGAHYEAMSTWAESEDFSISDEAVVIDTEGTDAGRRFLAPFMTEGELDRATRGRPSMSGTGTSPKRQVRLPVELDAALIRRAADEHRRPSDIMRDALAQYLHAS